MNNADIDQSGSRFRYCLVFLNPGSSSASAVKERIEKLRQVLVDCPVDVVETSEEGYTATKALLEKQSFKLGKHTLLCIAGGDGTTNQIIQALLTAKHLSTEERQTPILPLWGGNANDLAHMLNGSASLSKLEEILTKGHIVPIHPLQCTMTRENGTVKTRIAACYAGFGATAFIAMKLNKPAYRKSKLLGLPGGRTLQEFVTVLAALMEAPSFSVEDSDALQVVYERTFANGSRMARINRLPVQLTDETFYINTLGKRQLLSVIPRLLDLTTRRVSAKFLRSQAHFVTQQPIWAHFDGEPEEIPARTTIDVQLSAQPFYALSITLKPTIKK